jgi:hypothetical protein
MKQSSLPVASQKSFDRIADADGEFVRDPGPVFSLTDGYVWASWYDGREPINLGAVDAVIERMQDFIDQSAFGAKLCGLHATSC